MDVSVALCTYNGNEYLRSQLESILTQTREPDEIVIYDDGSTDQTRSLLSSYARDYPSLIDLHFNEENLGPTRNFERAIGSCSGDVIAVSDQDDVWRDNKLEEQLAAFNDQEASLIYHNSVVASESLTPETTLWDSLSPPYQLDNRNQLSQFESLVRRNYVQGASMLFDAALRNHCLPIPEYWNYDHWIAAIAACRGGIHGLDKQLLIYRQHENQAIGVTQSSFPRRVLGSLVSTDVQYRESVTQWTALSTAIEQMDTSEMCIEKDVALRAVESRIRYEESRVIIHNGKSRPALHHFIRNLRDGGYQQFGDHWAVAGRDLLELLVGAIL
ncbi:glycosyltransferase family 2 protein [Halobaculum rarum]|uniref:glycosyltransferase family 2 protein n=1 Tax=Halobaculum rarum TaxID=3075122 RepID=UPI0032AFD457